MTPDNNSKVNSCLRQARIEATFGQLDIIKPPHVFREISGNRDYSSSYREVRCDSNLVNGEDDKNQLIQGKVTRHWLDMTRLTNHKAIFQLRCQYTGAGGGAYKKIPN